jgi:hypothetical protein
MRLSQPPNAAGSRRLRELLPGNYECFLRRVFSQARITQHGKGTAKAMS